MHTETVTSRVLFERSTGWFGGEKSEQVAGFNAKLFEMSGFDFDLYQRKRPDHSSGSDKSNSNSNSNSNSIHHNNDISDSLPSSYWTVPPSKDKKVDRFDSLLFPGEKVAHKSRSFKGTVYFAKDFPHKIQELLPIFELLAPSNKHFAKLKSFVELSLPDEGFPIKIELPIVPAVSAVVTFLRFEQQAVDPNLFVIPSDYNVDNIQMNFEFSKEQAEQLKREHAIAKHIEGNSNDNTNNKEPR